LFALFTSCSKDSEDEPTLPITDTPTEVSVTVLKGAFPGIEAGPRMVIEADGWTVVEYRTTNAQHDEMTHFHFLNSDSNSSIIVSGLGKGAIIYEYNYFTNSPSEEVYITHEVDNNLIVSLCRMNWQTMEYETTAETIVEIPQNSNRSRGTFEDDVRRIFIKHLDNLSQNIDKMCYATSWLSKYSGISLLNSVWTKVAIPIAKYNLLDDVSEDATEINNEIITNTTVSLVLSVIPTPIQALGRFAYDKIASYFGNPITEEDVNESYGFITGYSNKSYRVIESLEGYIPQFKMNISVSDITETSVILNGSYTLTTGSMPHVASSGFIIKGGDGYYEEISSNFVDSYFLDNLTPGTEYIATAYIYSMGHRYESSVKFYTDISLSFYPESISFPAKGGSRGVALSIPYEMLKSWEIVSKPNWCEITKAASSFFVDVEASNKKREGEIVVKAIFQSGKTETGSIHVTQADAVWDGTNWNCSGTIKTQAFGKSFSQPLNFGISIQNVTSNKFSLSGDLRGLESMSKIYLDGEKLVWEMNYNASVPGISAYENCKITFTRIGETESGFTISGKLHVSGEYGVNGSFTGNGTGTIIPE